MKNERFQWEFMVRISPLSHDFGVQITKPESVCAWP